MSQQATFELWIREYRSVIFKIIRVYADTAADRDDLFQEVSFQIYRSIPSFKGQSAVTTWLYRVSLNTAIKWIRKEKKHRNQVDLEDTQHLLHDTGEKDERLDWLYDEISKMNDADKSLTLLLLEGMSYKEMAEITGLNPNNIGVKIHRIKNELIRKSENYSY